MNNIQDIPYFMKNKEWYIIKTDLNNLLDVQIKLTNKAPQEAKQSYLEWLKNSNIVNVKL